MKRIYQKIVFGCLTLLCATIAAQAQQTRYKVALFAPLYLDSAFDAGNTYRFAKSFPKFLNPGLEFYQGAQAALDSLGRTGAPLDVFVYDTRSKNTPLSQQLQTPDVQGAHLLIGHASAADVRLLADVAQQRKVPFISAALPNDAGVSNNPFYVILNSTLRTHCESIYRLLQRANSRDRIVVLRKSGVQEAQIRDYLQEMGRTASGAAPKITYEEFTPDYNPYRLMQLLDSNQRNIIIAGSLDEAFGNRVLNTASALANNYPITVIGMPTWDGFNLSRPEYKSFEIVYTSPFNYGARSTLATNLAVSFTARTNGRPTDMYFRGYETTLRFVQLLLETGKDMGSNLTRKGNTVFTAFDVQPVFLNKQAMQLDYFENKRLYFVRLTNGIRSVQ